MRRRVRQFTARRKSSASTNSETTSTQAAASVTPFCLRTCRHGPRPSNATSRICATAWVRPSSSTGVADHRDGAGWHVKDQSLKSQFHARAAIPHCHIDDGGHVADLLGRCLQFSVHPQALVRCGEQPRHVRRLLFDKSLHARQQGLIASRPPSGTSSEPWCRWCRWCIPNSASLCTTPLVKVAYFSAIARENDRSASAARALASLEIVRTQTI